MKFGDFELSIVRECTMKLDGGAMFGVVPKTLWNKVSPADEQNRILMTCNLLLIDTGTNKVLVETGMGERWSDKERERYELKSLVRAEEMLAPIGVKNDQVDAVIISHLHFDHAGGATRINGDRLVPTFPNAKYYVQKGEWEFAHNANARARASYRPDDYEPLLKSEQIVFMDGDTEVVPGVWAKVTGGHTSHHQVVYFESQGARGIFFADLMPTKSHVTPPWVMGYDHYPLHSCDEKSKWLALASAEKWLVVFDHELEVPWGHITLNDSKKYEFLPLPQDTLSVQARTEKVLALCSSSALAASAQENCRKFVIDTDSH
ncbi:MAG TPA: MBL fold metallo-hydrolase [Drouetiella sp.]|jgi:glyoxylase-like metal-dependent hydrolase (beta-lactamase superfamily II)